MFRDAKRDDAPPAPSLADDDDPPPASNTLTFNQSSPHSSTEQAQDNDPFADSNASPGGGMSALTRVQRRRSSNDVNQYADDADEPTGSLQPAPRRRWKPPARLPPAPLIQQILAASPRIGRGVTNDAGRENLVRRENEMGGRYGYGEEEEGLSMPGGFGRRVDAGSTAGVNDSGSIIGRNGTADVPQDGIDFRRDQDASTADPRESEQYREDMYNENYDDESNWGVRQWREAMDATQEELTHSILRGIALEEEIRALKRRLGEGSQSGEENEGMETPVSAEEGRHTSRVYESALYNSSQAVNAMVGSINFQEVALALLDLCGRSASNPEDHFGDRVDRLAAAVNSPPIGNDLLNSATLREVLLRALQVTLRHYSPLACSPDQRENFEDMAPPDLLWLLVNTVDPALQRELKAAIEVLLQACLPSNRWVALYMLLGELRTLGRCPDTGLAHAEWARQQVWAFKRRGRKHTERPIRVTDLRRVTWDEVREVPFNGSGMRWLKKKEMKELRKAREEQWEAVIREEEGEPQ